MTRGIQRFEASEDLFRRALSAGLGKEDLLGDAAETDAPQTAAEPAWRGLRLPRIEALDPEAQVPPPLLPLSPDAAIDVAEPEPEQTPPTPQELEEVLSEAVDLPDDWAMVATLAGGTGTAHCLRELLDALQWTGASRQVAEALPELHAPLDGSAAARTLMNLGYGCRSFKGRLNELGPQDFPALFVTKAGDALVLREFGQQAIPGFDGTSRTRRPIARDRRAGTVYAFAPTDGLPGTDPVPSCGIWEFLWSALRPKSAPLTAALAGQALCALAGPLLILIALDYAVPSESLPMILFYTGAALFAALMESGFRTWRDSLIDPVQTESGALALKALSRTLRLPPAGLAGAGHGARLARYRDFDLGGDAAPGRMAATILGLPVAVVAIGGVAFLGGKLVGAPLLGGLAMFAGWFAVRSMVRRRKVALVRAAGSLVQQVSDVEQVRGGVVAMGCEDVISERMMRAAETAADAELQDEAGRRRVVAWADWTAVTTVAATAVVAGGMGIAGDITAGSVAACILLSWFAMNGLAKFVADAGDAVGLESRLNQLRRLYELRPERTPGQPSVPPRRLAGHVDVSGVSTQAAGGIEMPLDDVSLYADPGEVVAIVGDYQSGKSALLRVLAGMQNTRAGHARLDGVETSLFDPVQLRQSVAYVPETPEFLPLSIEDNLRQMNPVASDSDLQAACELAGVMDDIRVLETGVGSNRRFGMAVDMAQFTRDPHPGFFKRIALARGYLRQSGLVLLDGPERHLDPAGEQALLRAVEQLRGQATVIIATDRPQLIRLADRVLWLDGGRVRAEGPSATVLQQLYDEGRVGQTLTEQ